MVYIPWTVNTICLYNYVQHLSICLVVLLGQIISYLSLGFPVTVEQVISANANYTIRQILVTIKEQLEYFAMVNYYTACLRSHGTLSTIIIIATTGKSFNYTYMHSCYLI